MRTISDKLNQISFITEALKVLAKPHKGWGCTFKANDESMSLTITNPTIDSYCEYQFNFNFKYDRPTLYAEKRNADSTETLYNGEFNPFTIHSLVLKTVGEPTALDIIK